MPSWSAGTSAQGSKSVALKVLLWRGWKPAFRDGLSYTTAHHMGVGGTELQMLWHAAHLTDLGHAVQILGAGPQCHVERGVDFVGADSEAEQSAAIRCGRVHAPDVILLEGAYHAAARLRHAFPRARIAHIGQNIDVGADRHAFAHSASIDAYAFVGIGHFADYCSRYPRLRGKFVIVRNAIPWAEFHSRVPPATVEEKVVWVGSWNKKGLRTWCEVLGRVFRERPTLRWTLCGPMYGSGESAMPVHLTHGLTLPFERVTVRSLPLPALLAELCTARVVIVSLGNECGPGSVLDAHAMARPVISGNDMVYAFSNPNGTGLRVSNGSEAHAALSYLLDDHAAGDALGRAGREFVLEDYHESRQRSDLVRLLDYLTAGDAGLALSSVAATSHHGQLWNDLYDKVRRKLRKWQAGL